MISTARRRTEAPGQNWLTTRPLGEWAGVTTDGDGRVTGLQLFNSSLSGPIPESLGDLTNLKGLDLSHNSLSGPIPESLGGLDLGELTLGLNELSGCIPAGLKDRYLSKSDLDQVGLAFCGE